MEQVTIHAANAAGSRARPPRWHDLKPVPL